MTMLLNHDKTSFFDLHVQAGMHTELLLQYCFAGLLCVGIQHHECSTFRVISLSVLPVSDFARSLSEQSNPC